MEQPEREWDRKLKWVMYRLVIPAMIGVFIAVIIIAAYIYVNAEIQSHIMDCIAEWNSTGVWKPCWRLF